MEGVSMFCPKCGSSNEDGNNFCANCSNPLEKPATSPAPTPQKKHILRNILIVLVVLVIVFFIWVGFSPDNGPEETTNTTPLTTTAADETTAEQLSVADTADQAVLLVQQFASDSAWELLYEENFIDNGDGSLSIEVNNPDAATVPCFVIQPVGGSDAEGYTGYYIVRKDTVEIYQHQDLSSSIVVKVSG
jgi:hypothetical protein